MTRRYTGANEQFRVDARILDGATSRTVWKSTSVGAGSVERWGTGTATPSSRRPVDGVDVMIQRYARHFYTQHRFRIAGAKALSEGTESFDKVLPDLADRPDMFLDDELAEEIEKKALAKGDREKW